MTYLHPEQHLAVARLLPPSSLALSVPQNLFEGED
jgi:hypothetical protein